MSEIFNFEQVLYMRDPNYRFYIDLNNKYNDLCFYVHKKKRHFNFYLRDILDFICEHWEYVDNLPREDIYMVLNVLKLAKSANMEMYMDYYESEKFQKMCENYTNSR